MEDTTTTIAAPSPETATPTAGPASPSASSPTAIERPRTMQEAFDRDAASQTDVSAPTGTATTQPAETTDPQSALHPSTEKPVGPVPLDVHTTALANARTKERQAAQAEFDRDFGWAKQIPRETIQEWSGIAQLMASDPAQFLEKYFAEAATHPTFGPQVKSWAARNLATRAPKADTMPEADVQILDAAGNVTGMTYSDKQLAARDEWRERQWMEKVNQRVQPFEQERAQKQADAKAAETTKQVDAAADRHVARIDQILDGDKALYEHVGQMLAADPSLDPIDAALEVRKTHLAPKLAGQAESKVLETLKTKAAAQGVNPAGAVVTATHRPRSLTDASLRW